MSTRPLITFAALAAAEMPESEMEVLRAGTYCKSGRDIAITTDDLDRAVDNFASGVEGPELPIDFDHGFHARGDSRCAGWITSLRRVGESLWARCRWTPEAARQIREHERRFASAEFRDDLTDEYGGSHGFGLTGAALTSRPFLRSLAPITFSRSELVAYTAPSLDSETIEDLVAADAAEVRADGSVVVFAAATDPEFRRLAENRQREDVDPHAQAVDELAVELIHRGEADTYERAVELATREEAA
jgi:phage I-like protein